MAKIEMLPEVDFMDVGARIENLAVRGEPVMFYQICIHINIIYIR